MMLWWRIGVVCGGEGRLEIEVGGDVSCRSYLDTIFGRIRRLQEGGLHLSITWWHLNCDRALLGRSLSSSHHFFGFIKDIMQDPEMENGMQAHKNSLSGNLHGALLYMG